MFKRSESNPEQEELSASRLNQRGLNSGKCPQCGSSEVYRGIATEGEGLTAGSYTLLVELRTEKSQVTLWADTFVCRSCGFLQMYVANLENLELLPKADSWERVDGL
jgi:predicted RNA-binding Zn-ribbon protein involved in translation (DUF1610 family)